MPRRTNTRERLIATAAELFRRQGYAQTGVNEIMKQAGTTSGSFYHFFPTKEDLLLAVVDWEGELLDSRIFGERPTGDGDAIDRIFAVLDAHRRYLESLDSTLGSPLGTLAAELSESHPQVRQRISELFDAWTDRMLDRLEETGELLPADVDHRAFAGFLLAAVEGASLRARVNGSLASFDSSVAVLRRLIGRLQERPLPGPPLSTRPGSPVRSRTATGDWRAW